MSLSILVSVFTLDDKLKIIYFNQFVEKIHRGFGETKKGIMSHSSTSNRCETIAISRNFLNVEVAKELKLHR